MQSVRQDLAPAAILASLNKLVHKSGGGITVTAIIAFIDRRRGTLTFASAGRCTSAAAQHDSSVGKNAAQCHPGKSSFRAGCPRPALQRRATQ
jgi:serine phosphatase RsbU (regulator of sigma subunit)